MSTYRVQMSQSNIWLKYPVCLCNVLQRATRYGQQRQKGYGHPETTTFVADYRLILMGQNQR